MADLKYVNFHSLYSHFKYMSGFFPFSSISLNQFITIWIFEHFISGQCWILFAITYKEVRNNPKLYGIAYFVLCRGIWMVIFVVWELKVPLNLSCWWLHFPIFLLCFVASASFALNNNNCWFLARNDNSVCETVGKCITDATNQASGKPRGPSQRQQTFHVSDRMASRAGHFNWISRASEGVTRALDITRWRLIWAAKPKPPRGAYF